MKSEMPRHATWRAEIGRRVRDGQGGVPTYADAALYHMLDEAQPPEVQRWLAAVDDRRRAGRFIPSTHIMNLSRQGRDVTGRALTLSQGVHEPLRWRGLPLFKSVHDYAIYSQLVAELQPATILEIGSGEGASAGWLAELSARVGRPAQVLSVDVRPPTVVFPGVMFLRGDAADLARTLPAEVLRAFPGPLLAIEDAHICVPAVLKYVHTCLRQGDYLIVEDSACKQALIAAFLEQHGQAYRIDTRYTDFFGLNSASAMNSIFLRGAQ